MLNLSTVLSASSFILHNCYEFSPKSAFIFFSPFQFIAYLTKQQEMIVEAVVKYKVVYR